jgi:hypothetical protein
MKIFDNLLSLDEEQKIVKCFLDKSFPYFFLNNSVTDDILNNFKNKNLNIKENNMFVHTFYNENKKISNNCHLVDFLYNKFCEKTNLKFKSILRCRLNLQNKQLLKFKNYFNTPHIDSDISHKVLLYYPNDTDGDTLIFNNNFEIIKRVEPKKGRFLLFEGHNYHAACVPVENEIRLAVNFDLLYDY